MYLLLLATIFNKSMPSHHPASQFDIQESGSKPLSSSCSNDGKILDVHYIDIWYVLSAWLAYFAT